MKNVACDVVVVGAGLSGLQAALSLRAAGLDVQVLEARNRVGGRAKPGQLAGVTVDLGGQWLGVKHANLAALAERLGVKASPQYAQGRNTMEFEGSVRTYRGLIPAMPLSAVLETGLALWRLNRMARSLPQAAPWLGKRAQEWDALSIEDWRRRHVRTRGANSMLDIAVRTVFCAEPKELSLLYFLSFVRANHSIENIGNTTDGAQAFLFSGGLHQLSTRMAAELGDRLHTASPVQRVRVNGARLEVECARGSWTARRLIVAVSPALIERIEFEPTLPAQRGALQAAVKMGSVIKVHVAYKTPFWRAKGLSGEALSDREGFGPVLDGHPHDERVGIISGFFAGEPARRWSARSVAERRAHVIECLVRWFGPEAQNPIDYLDQDWHKEEWSGGCYSAVMAPSVMTAYGAALREPCGAIHWAASETAETGAGYFEGALVSGMRAAREVIATLRE
jgi:monoamine oxidase